MGIWESYSHSSINSLSIRSLMNEIVLNPNKFFFQLFADQMLNLFWSLFQCVSILITTSGEVESISFHVFKKDINYIDTNYVNSLYWENKVQTIRLTMIKMACSKIELSYRVIQLFILKFLVAHW